MGTQLQSPNGKRGRHTKLTPAVQEKVCEIIRAGNYAEVAAEHAGISTVTYYAWLKRGIAGEEPFANFLNAVKKAESDSEAARVATIVAASAESWQAAAWWLERKLPHRWGRVVAINDWREQAKRAGYDPEQVFRDMVAAARARLVGSGGDGSVPNGDRGAE